MPSSVIIGASSGVGRALAERLAADGHDLLLVARDRRDLQVIASDLQLRFGRRCAFVAADIGSPDWDVSRFRAECIASVGEIDTLLIPAGGVSNEDVGPTPEVIQGIFATNFLGPARLTAEFGRAMAVRGSGALVLFSSIAAAAPRRRNAAYSAAKAALEVYAKALRHELEPKGITVLVVALGYVDTQQSYGMQLKFPIVRPEAVASFVVRSLQRGGGKAYFPWFWYWVTTLLRHLPWRVYSRLSF